MVDFREEDDGGEKMVIKLSRDKVLQLLNGKILEGFRTRIGVKDGR